jgi:hypothetical protein
MLVPEAADGTLFTPDLARPDGTFRIGPKDDERVVKGYRDALSELRRMDKPYWRRPSATSGIPGIVVGVRWVEVDSVPKAGGEILIAGDVAPSPS